MAPIRALVGSGPCVGSANTYSTWWCPEAKRVVRAQHRHSCYVNWAMFWKRKCSPHEHFLFWQPGHRSNCWGTGGGEWGPMGEWWPGDFGWLSVAVDVVKEGSGAWGNLEEGCLLGNLYIMAGKCLSLTWDGVIVALVACASTRRVWHKYLID